MTRFLTERKVEEEYSLTRPFLRKRRLLRLRPSFVKAGRKVLYARDEIENFLKENAVPAREVQP